MCTFDFVSVFAVCEPPSSNWSNEILKNPFFRCSANNKCHFIMRPRDFSLQGDIFSGLNDGILSRAEALADIGKHQSSHAQMSSQLKHDVMYHHSMGGPPQRPLQVSFVHVSICY